MRSYLEFKSGLASITKKCEIFTFFPNTDTADFSMRGYLGKSKTAGKGLYWAHNQTNQNRAQENQV